MEYKTAAKDRVLSIFRDNPDKTFCTEQIIEMLGGGAESSVYRIIRSFEAGGKLKKFTDDKTRRCRYQYAGVADCRSHLHLMCAECGRLIHLNHHQTQLIEDEIKGFADFCLDEKTTLFGKCHSCAKT